MTTINVSDGPEWVPWRATSQTGEASGTVDATDPVQAAVHIATVVGEGIVYDDVQVSHQQVADELAVMLEEFDDEG